MQAGETPAATDPEMMEIEFAVALPLPPRGPAKPGSRVLSSAGRVPAGESGTPTLERRHPILLPGCKETACVQGRR
jgi:hypothetical protein